MADPLQSALDWAVDVAAAGRQGSIFDAPGSPSLVTVSSEKPAVDKVAGNTVFTFDAAQKVRFAAAELLMEPKADAPDKPQVVTVTTPAVDKFAGNTVFTADAMEKARFASAMTLMEPKAGAPTHPSLSSDDSEKQLSLITLISEKLAADKMPHSTAPVMLRPPPAQPHQIQGRRKVETCSVAQPNKLKLESQSWLTATTRAPRFWNAPIAWLRSWAASRCAAATAITQRWPTSVRKLRFARTSRRARSVSTLAA